MRGFLATVSRGAVLVASLLLPSGCGDDPPSIPPSGPAVDGTARLLPLSGLVFRMGSDDARASPDERPGWTRFAHDVWMDTTEVTQEEFSSLMRHNPSATSSGRLPVANVSWFDAVLCANARSRRDGLDSVYEYVAVDSDSTGGVRGLAGLTIHLDREGWRLPTEAEWEVAARAGSNTPWPWGGIADSAQADSRAWFRGNAGGTAHAVASTSPNAWGLHDLAGNVMEWTNDWKGPFPTDTVVDFAGREEPGDVAEVPLKGGAFPYGLDHLRPSSRTATYAAYRGSRADYVGFRLVRGAFAASFLGADGGVVHSPPVAIVRSDVARLLDAWEARLVFVNRANGRGVLTWIDYGEATPSARSLPDSLPVFHPAISPDGRWVAWSTALEGSTGPSRIRARRLVRNDTIVLDLGEGAIPRWWVAGPDTFLVRAQALDNTSPDWGFTATTAQRWSGGALVGAVETWVRDGSFHDGRSGNVLYSGYRRLRQRVLDAETNRILFVAPANGKSEGDTSQVCNVSAAPDASGRVLFLDFGYGGVSTVMGRPYGIHEVAFVADSSGRILNSIPAPGGERQWEHLEWSNDPRWAISGSIDPNGAYRNLYLLDLEGSGATRLVSGQELWQPALWVGASAKAPASWLDSVGRYDLPVVVPGFQDQMAAKLVLARLQTEKIEIALLGSSRAYMGFDPVSFRSGRAYNLAVETGPLALSDSLARGLLLPDAKHLRAVVLDLHFGWMMWRRCDGMCQALSGSTGYRWDRAHPDAIASRDRTWQAVLASRVWPISAAYDTLGGGTFESRNWGANLPPTDFPLSAPADLDTTNAYWTWNLSTLDALAATLSARGILLVAVICPQSSKYAASTFSGFADPPWALYRQLRRQVAEVLAGHRGAVLYDAYRDGNHDYVSSEFWNESHLATSGARKLSRRIDSVVAAHLQDFTAP